MTNPRHATTPAPIIGAGEQAVSAPALQSQATSLQALALQGAAAPISATPDDAAEPPAALAESQASEAPVADPAPWREAVLWIASHYRIDVSPGQLELDLAWAPPDQRLHRLARAAGLSLHETGPDLGHLASLRLPVLVSLQNGLVGVVTRETKTGFSLLLSGEGGLETPLARDEMQAALTRVHVLRPLAAQADLRVDDFLSPARPDWLRRIVLADMRPYRSVMLASLLTNVLALAGTIFSMQVYDRVVPGQSLSTLWVLFIGVMLATAFTHVIRLARGRITDTAGKAADLRISERVFAHALRVRSSDRPKSTGSFISQVREVEHVRELLTSTTVAALADLPFFLLFCVMFWYIAGSLVWIPLAAMVLLVLPGLLAQKRLAHLAGLNTRESALRSAMLVEAVQGMDDIKSLQAETRFLNQWTHYNDTTASASMALRDLVNRLSGWAQTVQGAVFAVVIFFGAPMVMAGDMSTGVLVAASMLSSRMLAPLASVTQILNRWQQGKVARQALDGLMQLPLDVPPEEHRLHPAQINGTFALKGAIFGHDPQVPVLQIGKLEIPAGSRIALLGRSGAGKSTLLAALAGMMAPLKGEIRVDDLSMGLIDPAELRRDICLMSQTARLFHGTLRENLTLGAPRATDTEIIALLRHLGLADFVQRLPKGLDHLLQEGGLGLSGGQKQGLLLARVLLRKPRVLLLDEPTASLDDATEATVIAFLDQLPPDTTVIVATHRPAVMRIMQRILVLGSGQILMDGPKDKVLAQLRGGKA